MKQKKLRNELHILKQKVELLEKENERLNFITTNPQKFKRGDKINYINSEKQKEILGIIGEPKVKCKIVCSIFNTTNYAFYRAYVVINDDYSIADVLEDNIINVIVSLDKEAPDEAN